jgi:hypothetical protein
LVLDQLVPTTISTLSSESEEEMELVNNIHTLRGLIKSIYSERQIVTPNLERLIKSMDTLVLQNSLLRHKNTQLKETLITKKKRSKRDKPLGLLSKEEPKYSQF